MLAFSNLLALATTPLPSPTMLPDLRTAIATEKLATATADLAHVTGLLVYPLGLASLAAAMLVAAAAVRTYWLEAIPMLSIIGIGGKPPSGNPGTTVRRLHLLDADGGMPKVREWPQAADMVPAFYFHVRNVGRSTILEADLRIDVTVSGVPNTGSSTLHIASILPEETIYLPIAGKPDDFRIEVSDVRATG